MEKKSKNIEKLTNLKFLKNKYILEIRLNKKIIGIIFKFSI